MMMTMTVSQTGPVHIYIAVNNIESEIKIKLDSVTRVGSDVFSASGFLDLKIGDKVSVKLKTNGLLSNSDAQCTFAGHLLEVAEYQFEPTGEKPTFDRTSVRNNWLALFELPNSKYFTFLSCY